MMRRKTIEEIDQFIEDNKESRIDACTLGCGQVIKNQVIDYKIHDCPLLNCVKWTTKCRRCRAILGPTGNLLRGKEAIYQEWDKHNRKVKRLLEDDDK